MLSVKNIEKRFHNKTILNKVSFEVYPGEIVVFLGRSGVGKSTVIRVLNNLETIDSGFIQLDNQLIDFNKVGMVFQDFNLFSHLTIEENLMVPLTQVAKKSMQEARKITQELLGRFGLLLKAKSYPASLSGGQKQRVALARTLAMNPEVLCLDEPTSALDPTLKTDLANIITELSEQGLMIVVATHDILLLQQLDCKVHLMQDGKIVETATTKELHQNENKFKKIANFIKGK